MAELVVHSLEAGVVLVGVPEGVLDPCLVVALADVASNPQAMIKGTHFLFRLKRKWVPFYGTLQF